MTEEEKKEIIRVCGKDYNYWDIPAYIRKRDFEREQKLVDLMEEEIGNKLKNYDKEKTK
jgi:hypothetical protein